MLSLHPSSPSSPSPLYPLLFLLTISSALKLTFVPPAQLPASALPSSTTATLVTAHKPPLTAHLQRNGFTFRNISSLAAHSAGESSGVVGEGEQYLLQVHCPDWTFAPYRVDVVPDGKGGAKGGAGGGGTGDGGVRVDVYRTFLGNAWSEKGELKGRFAGGRVVGITTQGASGGAATAESATGNEAAKDQANAQEEELKVELEVLGRKEYYSAREGFNPLSLFRNPMILLALVSLVLVFGMPYMLDNMDPEMRKEFEEQQKQGPLAALTGMAPGGAGKESEGSSGGQRSAQGFDMAAWMAGHTGPSRGGNAGAEKDGSGGGGGTNDGSATGSSSGGGKARRRG